jgi:hypothetical protein
MCTWSPPARVAASFAAAFPHVVEIADGRVLLGSRAPIAVDPARWRERLESPDVRGYLGNARAERVWAHLERARAAAPTSGPAILNTDLYPRDEFNAEAGAMLAMSSPDER